MVSDFTGKWGDLLKSVTEKTTLLDALANRPILANLLSDNDTIAVANGIIPLGTPTNIFGVGGVLSAVSLNLFEDYHLTVLTALCTFTSSNITDLNLRYSLAYNAKFIQGNFGQENNKIIVDGRFWKEQLAGTHTITLNSAGGITANLNLITYDLRRMDGRTG